MANVKYFNLPGTCPKCGFAGLLRVGSVVGTDVWGDPRFRFGDYLEFRCNQCGYEITRPTVDQRSVPSPDGGRMDGDERR